MAVLRVRRAFLGNVKGRSGTVRALSRNPAAVAGASVVFAWLAIGLLAPVLAIDDPNVVALEQRLQSPAEHRPFGTDEVGRDVLSRVMFAARVSVPAGLVVVAASMIVGAGVGAIAGIMGGMVDQGIMRLCDAILSFPAIILAMAIAVARGGPGLENAVIAVIIVLWPEYARLMRGEVLSIKERDFVLAARAVGLSPSRLMVRHILPSANAPLVVKGTLDIGGAILLMASLSFLGFGAIPPTAEWGAMVSQGARVGLQFWWCSAFPGLAIMSVVMALNFFGDAVRDTLDPRTVSPR
jgi:peptide/nickel transport system permease protein